ncbi:right-handed parallel beta-helix repeat-containing protein [Myxococcus landrumensis]|uniref:Right-handed parallel beta-helix repeat-containing protein n=1 Tax=Myxococcus landrumensis TaxID=2813577 RepID=A0ABX7MZF4_9BACT|nr:right-handed parallel beta-helix repeat-containing protein [Myxococcus landrumus]QSQ11816.1 right-handed parallel beta-helix repeat-containing protein [Myxococcus landrumus]
MNRANTRCLALFASTLLLAMGCGLPDSPDVPTEPVGSALVVVVLPRTLASGDVKDVKVTVSPAQGGAVSASLPKTPADERVWQGWVRGIHTGAGASVNLGILGASDALLGQASVDLVELKRHLPALLVLVPQPSGTPRAHTAPVIDAVVGSHATVSLGQAVKLRALARPSEQSETLTYEWSAKVKDKEGASAGTFKDASNDASLKDVEWKAPNQRDRVTVTLKVTGSRGGVTTLDFDVDVALGGEMRVERGATFNRTPVLMELGVNPIADARVGAPIQLQTAGVDDDGDTLTYEWSATCTGTFGNAGAPVTQFTPSSLPRGDCNNNSNCVLTVKVSDEKGFSHERTTGVCVRSPMAPIISSLTPSAAETTSGVPVWLAATARDPQGEPLTFTWSANTGLLGHATRAGGSGEADWVALSCLPVDTLPTVSLTVTNTSGLSATRTVTVEWTGPRCGEFAPCDATLGASTVSLTNDCTTEQSLWIPDGYTLDGAEHVLTAVDPRGGRFLGAVLRNRGSTAHVRRVKVSARGLSELVCDDVTTRLRGVLFDGASGSIVDSEVLDMSQRDGLGACQEGVGIEVRNALTATSETQVEVLRNHVARYQKAGIVGSGRVKLSVEGNRVDGGGPVSFIARNGIQFSNGATGRATRNEVAGNAYSGGGTTAAGILVAGGDYYRMALCEDIDLFENTLVQNDIGINVSQADGDGNGPPVPTGLRIQRNRVEHEGWPEPYAGKLFVGIWDLGGANLISQNRVSGAWYERATRPDETFDVIVEAGAASQIAFLTPARSVGVGQCSEALVVQSQDARGNLTALGAPSLVMEVVGSSAPGSVLYADAACTQELARAATGWELVLAKPQQEASFYFKATQKGELTFKAKGDGLEGTQVHTVR